MKLSERVRSNVEAAPWVIEEIKRLEEQLSDERKKREESERKLSNIKSKGEYWLSHEDEVRTKMQKFDDLEAQVEVLREVIRKSKVGLGKVCPADFRNRKSESLVEQAYNTLDNVSYNFPAESEKVRKVLEAAEVLVEFAKTAPGRLPVRERRGKK